MVIRVDVVEAALRERWGADPIEGRGGRRVVALAAGGGHFTMRLLTSWRRRTSWRSCAAATRASTSGSTSTWRPTSSRSDPTSWRAASSRRWSSATPCSAKLPGALGHDESAPRSPSAWRWKGRPSTRTSPAPPSGEVCCARGPALRRPRSRARVEAGAEPPPRRRALRLRAPGPSLPFAAARRAPKLSRLSLAMSGVIDSIERAQLRRIPAFQAGDRVRVHFQVVEGTRRRTQVFEGVVIKRQGSGVRETFTVRKQSFGVGVERTFPVHSPKIERIEVAGRGDVRRAKLYYLRDRVGRGARVRERRFSASEEDYGEGVMPPPEADAPGVMPPPDADEADVEAGAGRATRARTRWRRAARGRRDARPQAQSDEAAAEANVEEAGGRGRPRRGSRRRGSRPGSGSEDPDHATSPAPDGPSEVQPGSWPLARRKGPRPARSSSWSRSSPSHSAWPSASRRSSSSRSASQRVHGPDPGRRPARAGRSRDAALRRPRPGRHHGLQAASRRGRQRLRRRATREGSACPRPTKERSDTNFIKRVVAVGGDRLSIREGRVVHQRQGPEGAFIRPTPTARSASSRTEITIPKGHSS